MSEYGQASILIVDDDVGGLLAMQEVVRTTGARAVTASSGEEALRHVLDEDFAAILMDVRMPGIDGFTTASLIRERKRSRYTPIIFLTAATEDLASMFKSYRAGAVDFMVKPIIPEVLKSKLARIAAIKDREALSRVLGEELRADVDPLNSTHFHTTRLFGLWVSPDWSAPTFTVSTV